MVALQKIQESAVITKSLELAVEIPTNESKEAVKVRSRRRRRRRYGSGGGSFSGLFTVRV